MDKDNRIYQVLKQTQTSYTNHAKIKHSFFNLIFFLKKIYPENQKKYIESYTRKSYKHNQKKVSFG